MELLRRVESRRAIETTHRVQQNCGQVFRYAVATARAESDPSRDLRDALTPWRPEHYATLTDPREVGRLLRDIESYEGSFATRCAMNLAPMLFVRPGELRRAEWSEIDLDKGEWRIPAAKMKGIRQTNEVAAMEQRKQTHAMTDAARAIVDKEVGPLLRQFAAT